jgi:hypothetical protein
MLILSLDQRKYGCVRPIAPMARETSAGSISALAVTFDVAGARDALLPSSLEMVGSKSEEGSRHQGTEGMLIRAANLGRGFTCRRIAQGRCRIVSPTTIENARGLGALTRYIEA